MSKSREMGSSVYKQSDIEVDGVTARRVPSKWKEEQGKQGEQGESKGNAPCI
jgi:hypothetical protein